MSQGLVQAKKIVFCYNGMKTLKNIHEYSPRYLYTIGYAKTPAQHCRSPYSTNDTEYCYGEFVEPNATG